MTNDQYPMACHPLMPLSLVPANRSVVLHRVRGGCGVSAHLASMGLLPGVRIQVRHNDLRGPVLIGLNDSRLALGRGMAQKLSVKEVAPAGRTGTLACPSGHRPPAMELLLGRSVKGVTTYSGTGT